MKTKMSSGQGLNSTKKHLIYNLNQNSNSNRKTTDSVTRLCIKLGKKKKLRQLCYSRVLPETTKIIFHIKKQKMFIP